MRRTQMLIAAAIITVSLVAVAQEDPTMPSIVIKQAVVETKETPLNENEREYWECVLEHMQGTQSDDAVNVILAACRALYGSGQPE